MFKLTMITPERRQWLLFDVFMLSNMAEVYIINFQGRSHFVLVFQAI